MNHGRSVGEFRVSSVHHLAQPAEARLIHNDEPPIF